MVFMLIKLIIKLIIYYSGLIFFFIFLYIYYLYFILLLFAIILIIINLDSEEVGEAPVFVEPVKPRKVKAKKSIELRCVVKGIPIPEIIWCRENEQIITDDREFTTSFDSETGEAILTIAKPIDEDRTAYLARAVNIHGKSECMAYITFGKFNCNICTIHI